MGDLLRLPNVILAEDSFGKFVGLEQSGLETENSKDIEEKYNPDQNTVL